MRVAERYKKHAASKSVKTQKHTSFNRRIPVSWDEPVSTAAAVNDLIQKKQELLDEMRCRN